MLTGGSPRNAAAAGYPEDAVDDMLQTPTSRLIPKLPAGGRVTLDGKELLVFEVESMMRAVMVTGNGFPYRAHDQVVRMSEEAINTLKQRGLVESAEARPITTATFTDLDDGLLRRAMTAAGMADAQPTDYLLRRRLADRRGDAAVLREGALLLFARDASVIEHPNASIRVFRVKGTERKTGEQHNVQELPRVEGCLLAVLEQARTLLQGLIRSSAKLHDLFFREMPEYPPFAWQEALVNAVAHRDYAVQGRAIEVFLYDDRMEVVSPGALLPEVPLDDLRLRKSTHASRNPRIGRVLAELGIMREQGEGIPRMIEEMEQSWLPLPEFEADASTFRVVLRNEPIFKTTDANWVRAVRSLPLHTRQKRALIVLADRDFTNGDYQDLNKVDRDDAYRELRELVDRDLLDATGRGRGAIYRVRKEAAPPAVPPTPLEALVARLDAAGQITNSDYREAFGVDRLQAWTALSAWVRQDVLVLEGSGRGARYRRGPAWPPKPRRE
jgi:ATP-dependent DNA helicase RecG